jgi:hypothetical protein
LWVQFSRYDCCSKTSPMSVTRIELDAPLSVFTFVSAVAALIGAIGMLIQLSIFRIPGAILHRLMFVIQILNIAWQSMGLYTGFVNFGPTVLNDIHFTTGSVLILLGFVTQLELLRLFESVTRFSSKNITIWIKVSVAFFFVLITSWVLAKFKILPEFWGIYWLVVWIVYASSCTLWIKAYVTVKLYKSMLAVKGTAQKEQKIKANYKRIIWQNSLMWLWEPVLGYTWVHGWLFEKDLIRRRCFLKIGEAAITYHFLMVVFFLKVIKKFKFGEQKFALHAPVLPSTSTTKYNCKEKSVVDTKII